MKRTRQNRNNNPKRKPQKLVRGLSKFAYARVSSIDKRLDEFFGPLAKNK